MPPHALKDHNSDVLFFNNSEEAAAAIHQNLKSRLTTMQHQHCRARKPKKASPGGQQQVILTRAANILRDGAGKLESYAVRAAKGRTLTLGQTAHSTEAWKFVVIDPTKETDLSAKQDLHAFLATRTHHQRQEKLECSITGDQFLEIENAVPQPVGRKGTNQTPPSGCSKGKRAVPADKWGFVCTHPLPDHAILREDITSPPLLLRSLQDPTDQLNIYARYLGTSVSTIWAYYLWQEREHGRLFQAQYERFRGYGPKYLHPIILTDPAVSATTVLFTACLLHQRDGKSTMSPAILHLRSHAYNIVQSAIDLSDRPSNSTILAVIKLALFEATFGQRDAYAIHMQGLVRMVQLRNGLSGLKEEDRYLAHLLMWFDANLSAKMRTSRYLLDVVSAEDTLQEAKADGKSFTLGL